MTFIIGLEFFKCLYYRCINFSLSKRTTIVELVILDLSLHIEQNFTCSNSFIV